jgi:hypothetical protein
MIMAPGMINSLPQKKNNPVFIMAVAMIAGASAALADDSADPESAPMVTAGGRMITEQYPAWNDQSHEVRIRTADSGHDPVGTGGSENRTDVARGHADESAPFRFEAAGLFAAGGSSADNDELRILQGGKHDPRQNGFTLQGLDVSFSSNIDPRLEFRGGITAIIDAEKGSVFELEELYLITKDIYHGMQVKAGRYFAEFGRENALHPHDWDFVDRPFILTRFFGPDSLTSQGVSVAWRTTSRRDSQVLFGVSNPKGEEQISFLAKPGDEVGGHALISRDVRAAGDLLYLARWTHAMNFSMAVGGSWGISGLWGPNASGTTTDTSIYGADVHFVWRAPDAAGGSRFVWWDTEVLRRRYEAADPGDPAREILEDRGLFTQVLWRFKPDWVAGFRFEYAGAKGNNAMDAQRDARRRFSPNLTWPLSDHARIRFQYNRDSADHLPKKTADAFWLQVQFGTGDHDDHEH